VFTAGSVVLVLRFALSGVLVVAAVLKCLGFRSWVGTLDALVPSSRAVRGLVAFGIPALELGVGALLAFRSFALYGAIAAAVMFLVFATFVALRMRQGDELRCYCFGTLGDARLGPAVVVRNLVFFAAAALTAALEWKSVAAMSSTASERYGFVWLAVLVFLAACIHFRSVWRGSKPLATKSSEPAQAARVSADVARMGLPIGSELPPAIVRRLDGTEADLRTLVRSGEPTVLVFSSPHCPTCRALMAELGHMRSDHAPASFAVFVVGEPVGTLCDHVGADRCFVGNREMMKALQISILPTAVRVDRQRRIGSGVVLGGDAIAALVHDAAEHRAVSSDAEACG
jgi:hypothetical protein